jgi:GT2 family glycosyltransferase
MSIPVSIVVPLTGGPEAALRCLVALSDVPDVPAHEVVVVDDASVGLEDLLARIDGDAAVVRRAQRGGLAAAWRSGVERATGETVVLLAGAPEVAPDFLGPLHAALSGPGVALATAGAGDPVAAPALAARRDALRALPVLDVPDALAPAAVAARLAASGAVVSCPGSRVGVAPTRDAAGRGLDRNPPGTPPELTVVIPTLDATSERLRRCVAAIGRATQAPHDIVIVDNGAPPQGFTAPVNAGIRAARGRFVVVCNDDVEVLPGWWPPLRDALEAGAAVAFPQTIDGAMRHDFAAWCFAVSRVAIERHSIEPGEFFHPGLRVWYQDTDLLLRLRAAGTPPVFVPDAHVRHGLSETVATEDPALRAWIDRQVEDDRLAFERLHPTAVVTTG